MSSLLERLFVTASVMVAPIFAAASTPKKAPRKAAERRKVKTARPARAKKAALRPVKKPKPASTRGAKNDRGSARQKEQVPPTKTTASRAPSAEPAHKPVPPTGRAMLLAPENGKYADSVHPKFRWLSVGGATRYEVAWSEHSDLSAAHSVISVATEAVVPVEKPLRVGATYHWRVRGGNESGWGPWSPAISFQVLEEPPAP